MMLQQRWCHQNRLVNYIYNVLWHIYQIYKLILQIVKVRACKQHSHNPIFELEFPVLLIQNILSNYWLSIPENSMKTHWGIVSNITFYPIPMTRIRCLAGGMECRAVWSRIQRCIITKISMSSGSPSKESLDDKFMTIKLCIITMSRFYRNNTAILQLAQPV